MTARRQYATLTGALVTASAVQWASRQLLTYGVLRYKKVLTQRIDAGDEETVKKIAKRNGIPSHRHDDGKWHLGPDCGMLAVPADELAKRRDRTGQYL